MAVTLIKRDELVRKHGQQVQKEVESALARLDAALRASAELPLVLDFAVIGPNHAVQNEVTRIAKESGYVVKPLTVSDGTQRWEVK